MEFYPATVVAVDSQTATIRMEKTGKQIVLSHTAANAVPAELRQLGVKGFISFPKAPPVFTAEPSVAEKKAA